MNPMASIDMMDTTAVATLPEGDRILQEAATKDIIDAISATNVGMINVSN